MSNSLTIQAIYLELIRRTHWNDFNGDEVAGDLEARPDLWDGVILINDSIAAGEKWEIVTDLLTLRDIKDNQFNASTIYILTKQGKEDELYELCRRWNADEVDFIGGTKACGMLRISSPELRANEKTLLRIWWD